MATTKRTTKRTFTSMLLRLGRTVMLEKLEEWTFPGASADCAKFSDRELASVLWGIYCIGTTPPRPGTPREVAQAERRAARVDAARQAA